MSREDAYKIARHFMDFPKESAQDAAWMVNKGRSMEDIILVQQVAAIKAHVTMGTYEANDDFRRWLLEAAFTFTSEGVT